MHYDWFIDTVPQVIERVEQAEKRGKDEGKLEGKIEGKLEGKIEGKIELARQMVLEAVQSRFPTLMNFAETQVATMTQPAQLSKLVFDLIQAPDEITVVHLLSTKGA